MTFNLDEYAATAPRILLDRLNATSSSGHNPVDQPGASERVNVDWLLGTFVFMFW